MNLTDEKPCPDKEATRTKPSRIAEIRQVLEDYANDLREIKEATPSPELTPPTEAASQRGDQDYIEQAASQHGTPGDRGGEEQLTTTQNITLTTASLFGRLVISI